MIVKPFTAQSWSLFMSSDIAFFYNHYFFLVFTTSCCKIDFHFNAFIYINCNPKKVYRVENVKVFSWATNNAPITIERNVLGSLKVLYEK